MFYPAGKLERLKNVEWKEPLGKGLRVTSKIVGAVSDFVPFAGIVKGATSMVADMLDPPVTLDQIRDCSLITKLESKLSMQIIMPRGRFIFSNKFTTPVLGQDPHQVFYLLMNRSI